MALVQGDWLNILVVVPAAANACASNACAANACAANASAGAGASSLSRRAKKDRPAPLIHWRPHQHRFSALQECCFVYLISSPYLSSLGRAEKIEMNDKTLVNDFSVPH